MDESTQRAKYPGAPGPPYCCQVGCEKDAEFVLTMDEPGVPYDVAETHACVEHVGALLGGPEDGPSVTRWVVTSMAPGPALAEVL